jgi:hypothetical protein
MVIGVPLLTHVINSLWCLVGLTVIDVGIVKRITSSTGSRWFALHALANLVIVVMCIPDVITTLLDPSTACSTDKNESAWPTYMVMGLHLAHCVLPWYSSTLNAQDYIHHFVFAFRWPRRWGGCSHASVPCSVQIPSKRRERADIRLPEAASHACAHGSP